MPDITMCNGIGCPFANYCYRVIAEPSVYQAWFEKIPYQSGDMFCEHYVSDCPRPDPADEWKEKRQ